MTEGPIFRMLITFGIPIILSSVIQQLYSTVDLIVIGKYVGSIGTVAVSTGSELTDFLNLVAMALSSAAGIYIAQLCGAGDKKSISKAIGTLFSITIIFVAVLTVAAIVFHPLLLRMINCPWEAYSSAVSYLIITACGLPFIYGYNILSGILRGMGESRRPLLFVIIAATINIFLDILFVAVFKLDAAGTAIAA